MMIQSTLLKKIPALLLPLMATLVLMTGCGEQPTAAQSAEGHGHEHATERGRSDTQHTEHEATQGSHESHDHADEPSVVVGEGERVVHGNDHASESSKSEREEAHQGHDHAADETGDEHQGHEHAAEEGEHAQHEGGHGDHDDHGGGTIQLTEQEREEFGVELRTAGAAALSQTLSLPGEVVFDPDRVAHVTPRVPGVVQRVTKGIGDVVEAGDMLAVLDSRELAQAKSAYLAAQAKLELAQSNFDREKRLFEQEISPEAAFLKARQARREAEIDLQLAERELHALGLNEQQVANLPEQDEEELTRYELAAPINGTIIERHLTRGEVVPAQPDEPPFVVASTGTVWVQLTVYPKNLGQVRSGQQVQIAANNTHAAATGTIDYVSPQVRQETRTALARVVLDNTDGTWRPGQFVSAQVQLSNAQASIVVPASALQRVEEQTVVYVQTPEGFEPRPVEVGQRNQEQVEILSGLQSGERYAATNTFTLKAEQGRGLLEHAGHSH